MRGIPLTSVVFLLTTVALAVYSQLVWKARALAHAGEPSGSARAYVVSMLLDPWIWTSIASTGFGMITWMLALRRLDLSLAYPATALVYVFVPVGAYALFGEALPAVRIWGLGFILLGIILVAQSG